MLLQDIRLIVKLPLDQQVALRDDVIANESRFVAFVLSKEVGIDRAETQVQSDHINIIKAVTKYGGADLANERFKQFVLHWYAGLLMTYAEYDHTLQDISNVDKYKFLSNGAFACVDARDIIKAETMLKILVGFSESSFGLSSSPTARCYNDLATIYQRQRKYLLAIPYLEKALKIQLDTLGEMDITVSKTLNNLAGMKYSIKDYDGALPLYKHVRMRVR